MSTATATHDAPADSSGAEDRLEELTLFEGYRVAETRLNFSGNNLIDRDLAEDLELGAEVELVITGKVVSVTHRPTEGRLASSSRAVAIETVKPA